MDAEQAVDHAVEERLPEWDRPPEGHRARQMWCDAERGGASDRVPCIREGGRLPAVGSASDSGQYSDSGSDFDCGRDRHRQAD